MSARIDNLQYKLDKRVGDPGVTETIDGLVFKYLRTFPDSRGFFREVIRVTDPFFENFAQWSHSRMQFSTVKAWHFHHRQIDWWYVGEGVLECAFYDNRPDSPTYKSLISCKLGDTTRDTEALEAVVKIPQGVLHGCKALTDFASMLYITSETYDPQDEGRIPFNSPEVPYFWGEEKDIIVADNDRKLHVPPYQLGVPSSQK